MRENVVAIKYFLSYSGAKLPLKLISPIEVEGLTNRNTYIRAYYDSCDRLISCEKVVYGEVELRHDYEYNASDELARAMIDMGGEETEITFDSDGRGSVRNL